MNLSSKKRITFVCLGNIVRSPLAEALFTHLAEEQGMVDKYEVDSAGIGPWHVGESPDQRMRRVAARHGLSYNGRGRQIQRGDLQRSDLIIAMDTQNYDELVRLAQDDRQRQKIHLLREFDPSGGPRAVVPDPYYGGIDGFEHTYQVIERSCRGLLQALSDGIL